MIVGAGQLGTRVAQLWREKFPDSRIYLKTNTHDKKRAEKWESMGFHALSLEEPQEPAVQCPYVVFCVPPIGNSSN